MYELAKRKKGKDPTSKTFTTYKKRSRRIEFNI